jgi:hypothetical protein
MGQRLTGHVLHDQIRSGGVGLAVVVHLGDPWCVQPTVGPRFGAQLDPKPLAAGLGQHLDRDRAVEHFVVRAPHQRHATAADQLGQPITAADHITCPPRRLGIRRHHAAPHSFVRGVVPGTRCTDEALGGDWLPAGRKP